MTSAPSYAGEEIDQTSFGQVFTPTGTSPQPMPSAWTESEPRRDVECLCPFCGNFNTDIGKPCPSCKTTDTTRTREASTRRTGPWYLLQPGNPDTAGLNFDDLLILIRNHEVTSQSVLRGPTTGQLWRLASKVRGVSREFGQCYCCAGDINKDETMCPHCDRNQTVPEHADAIPPVRSSSKPVFRSAPVTPPQPAPGRASAAAPTQVPTKAPVQVLLEDPESPKAVRQALLAEPIIHVHSHSHPDPVMVDPVATARPVVAEVSEPHYPKDDLLTPADLAKAFQLEFGPRAGEVKRFLTRPGLTFKKIKPALAVTGALALAVLLLWPLGQMAVDWMNDAPPARSLYPIAANAGAGNSGAGNSGQGNSGPGNSTSTATSGLIAFAAPDQPIFPQPVSLTNRSAAATVASAILSPTIVPDPDAAPSAQDDPKVLWNAALDAESTGNYSAAVWAYERIQSLPSDNWPAKLEVRLALARRELKGDVR